MNGRMDLAVLYGDKAIHGLSFLPLLKEPLFLVGPAAMPAPAQPVKLADLRDIELFLPRPYNVVRKLVDAAFVRAGMVPRVVAEIESAFTLTAAIADGLGATILPASMAREVVAACGAWQFQIVDPVIEAPLALCQSDHLPLSEPAQAVKSILLELVVDLAGTFAATPEPELAALS
jgi:LysR family nitrogen assimilation transcriptional regulator